MRPGLPARCPECRCTVCECYKVEQARYKILLSSAFRTWRWLSQSDLEVVRRWIALANRALCRRLTRWSRALHAALIVIWGPPPLPPVTRRSQEVQTNLSVPPQGKGKGP